MGKKNIVMLVDERHEAEIQSKLTRYKVLLKEQENQQRKQSSPSTHTEH